MDIKIIRKPVDKKKRDDEIIAILYDARYAPISGAPQTVLKYLADKWEKIKEVYDSQEGEIEKIEIKGNSNGIYGKNGFYTCLFPETIIISKELLDEIVREVYGTDNPKVV